MYIYIYIFFLTFACTVELGYVYKLLLNNNFYLFIFSFSRWPENIGLFCLYSQSINSILGLLQTSAGT